MSWYPDLHIGELRPWPDAVYVWRGQTGENQRYLPDDFYALARENNELRELVRDIWQFTGAACKKYPRLFDPPAQGGQMVQPNAIDAFEQRMRELGIEVDA